MRCTRRSSVLAILALFVMLLFLIQAAAALTTIEITPVTNKIKLGEKATFAVKITNNEKATQTYRIFSPSFGWNIYPFPPKNGVMELGGGESRTTDVIVEPAEDFLPGFYPVKLSIVSDTTTESYAEELKVFILPSTPAQYLPSIKVTADMNDNINPHEPQVVRLTLENQNPLNLKGTVVRLQSDFSAFNTEQVVDLSPLEKKVVEFTVTPDRHQAPGGYVIFILFEKDGETVKVVDRKVNVITLTPPFIVDKKEANTFLKTVKTLTVTNDGNVKTTQAVKEPTGLFRSIFTTTNAKAIVEEGQRFFAWELTLGAGEATTAVLTENLRIPFYTLLLVIIALILYFIYRSPLVIRKSATGIGATEEVLSHLKVTLHLRNVGGTPLKNVEITDIVHGITLLEKDIDTGTIKPFEIKPTVNGTLVRWKLGEIEPKEERLIHYRLKSKLHVLGAMKLPRAKGTFDAGKKGKKKVSYSNSFRIAPKKEPE